MRSIRRIVVGVIGCWIGASAIAQVTETPFTYYIDYEPNQSTSAQYLDQFNEFAPTLHHPGPDLRYLGRWGVGSQVLENRTVSWDDYKAEVRAYLEALRKRGVRWVTPYLCNQTATGNDKLRRGLFEVYDRWEDFSFLGLGPKPADPLEWMQMTPRGTLSYNYKRMVFLERHGTDTEIRYAPSLNHPDWRRICNNEARLAAELGFDGLFIDNNIFHCYNPINVRLFQNYLETKYTPQELLEAFGTEDYTDLELYAAGDLRYWAYSLDGFISWLEDKYSGESRRINFDTTGPLDPVHVDNAGGGTLVGDAAAFVAQHMLPPGVRPNFENLRLANPALQSGDGLLKWAETQMFWADSVGSMLEEMRKAGQSANPEFFLIPNWGTMQRVNAAMGRMEDGKDMRRWKRGSTWQMFEEGFATGQIAPGVIVEYDLDLRFALANGVRGMLLPYGLEGDDPFEVALAETAASGGSVYVATELKPDILGRYQQFFDDHAFLFEGYRSAARVGLAHFFDQTYYLNAEHLRQVHALNQFLADQQIPFAHVIEDDLDPESLARFDVLILPNVRYVSDEEVRAIQDYAERGGLVVLVGEYATHDRRCQPRSTPVASTESNRFVWFKTLDEALPYDGIYLEPGLQAAEMGNFDEAFSDRTLGKYLYLEDLDRRFWFKRYQAPGPLTLLIAKTLGEADGRDTALSNAPGIIDPYRAMGVRSHMYERSDRDGTRITIHLVNKNVPLAVPETRRILEPVLDLAVRLPLSEGARVKSAKLCRPGEPDEPLAPTASAGGATVSISRLDAYAVIALEVNP